MFAFSGRLRAVRFHVAHSVSGPARPESPHVYPLVTVACLSRPGGKRRDWQIRAYSSAASAGRQPDVVVVGSGLSGICTAIAAAEKGASVLVLERGHGGGASALSGGVVYAGGGTRQQKEAGHDETPDNMLRYLRVEVGDAVDEATLKRFCDESVARQEWLESHGAKFGSSLCTYKTSYPIDKYDLYYSGNERAHPFAKVATPVPRGHRTVGGPGMTGKDLWKAMFDSALRLGVRFQPATKVEGLLVDSTGRVEGVRYRSLPASAPGFSKHQKLTKKSLDFGLAMQPVANWYDGRAEKIWEREALEETIHPRAVVIAAGGFVKNESMRNGYVPWDTSAVAPLGTVGCDGSGIRLGQSVGGSVSHMGGMSVWRFLSPPTALLEGIVVSAEGQRIAAEDLYGASFSHVMSTQYGGRGFLVLDSTQWSKAKSQLSEQTQQPLRVQPQYILYWSHKKASSLHDLAGKVRIPTDALKAAVDAYNDAIANGTEDPKNKLEYRSPILKAPFYVVDVSLRKSGIYLSTGLTLGGLRVSGTSGLVLNEAGREIPGLYAAGRSATGICSNSYISGLSLADCVFSGKRAGEHAAGQARTSRNAATA